MGRLNGFSAGIFPLMCYNEIIDSAKEGTIMTDLLRMKNLSVPQGMVDVVLDSDAYNEIDDQFAISYLLKSKEKLNTKAIYAAPFLNERSVSPADGMEKSYQEILKLLSLLKEQVDVFRGSQQFMSDENTAVSSAAALDLAERKKLLPGEAPLCGCHRRHHQCGFRHSPESGRGEKYCHCMAGRTCSPLP